MYFNISKTMNILMIAALSLVILIALILFIKISDRSNKYNMGADIHDTYDPYNSWGKAR